MAEVSWSQVALIFVIVLAVGATGYFVLRVIEKSLNRSAPASLVGVLTMIVVLGLLGYLGFGETRPELIAIASTALGALTATLTGMNTRAHLRPPEEPPDPVPDEDEPPRDDKNPSRDID